MQARTSIEAELEDYAENQLIFASQLYQQKLADKLTEAAYYKAIERLCKESILVRVAKGIYCKPKQGRYGLVMPSEQEIIHEFTKKGQGTVVGYTLYNSLNLTTQIAKTVEVYSLLPDQQTKRIGSVVLKQKELRYSKDVTHMIHMLEVLKNYDEIQDLNHSQFLKQYEMFAERYADSTFDYVYQHIRYPKSTVAFLREGLNYYGVPNHLSHYLSSLSTYHHPKMEELYETARISK
jgi:hypothetical protein